MSIRKYETRCKQDSIKIAKAFSKLRESNWTDKDYEKYSKMVKKTKIPKDMQQNIETEIARCDGNFRAIDIYQFWG